ncbi:tumor necrosis factor receptor superfamily member 14 isoform X3 [Peromyscus maniculatus bairdii]|uniref:tumor necrosis factor receptor superfamily member 14 isoform X3 n=1 Tax=Peromyscus maniculatus bairdii TaxID=230844 RepID=UPI00077D9531|nr:tumor necrosis factor receptor superfamily member 14 isoform X4 [Peromyscus maniculatus bairdii]
MGLLACSVLIRNMEPLPGWGSSPWSQAPTANTFRLVWGVFLLNVLCCFSVQPECREEEYSVGDECCPMCNPDMGLVTWRECSSREDTVCRCSPGYFCEIQEGDHCSTCLPHTTCPRGQRVLKRGNYSQDTVCADCLIGTFSPGGTREECLPWTKCNAWFQKEVEHGTSSTDVTCSFSWTFYVIFIFLGLLAAVLIIIYIRRKRPHTRPGARGLELLQGQKQENTVKFPVTEVGFAVTEEETAFNPVNSG